MERMKPLGIFRVESRTSAAQLDPLRQHGTGGDPAGAGTRKTRGDRTGLPGGLAGIVGIHAAPT